MEGNACPLVNVSPQTFITKYPLYTGHSSLNTSTTTTDYVTTRQQFFRESDNHLYVTKDVVTNEQGRSKLPYMSIRKI